MRIVIALGGNPLLQRGQPMTADNQRANIRLAAQRIAAVADGNQLVIAHGNGPQVGLLALQGAAYQAVQPYPLDVLGAETEAMIGYVVEQELGNLLPFEQPLATLLTMVQVDPDDPAFQNPTKPIGPVYDEQTARRLSAENGWTVAPDGDRFRRVVPSPAPQRIFEIRPIRMLVEAGVIVICAGGGGIRGLARTSVLSRSRVPCYRQCYREACIDRRRGTGVIGSTIHHACTVGGLSPAHGGLRCRPVPGDRTWIGVTRAEPEDRKTHSVRISW